MPQRSKLQAIAGSKCPKCRQGEVFTHGPLNLIKLGKTHETCSHCGLRYEIEPGFFWAAMYISYGINVAIMITCLVATRVLFNPESAWPYLLPIFIGFVLCFPFTMRYSRVLLLHFFAGIKYDPKLAEDWIELPSSKPHVDKVARRPLLVSMSHSNSGS